jgi:hypothetical protein
VLQYCLECEQPLSLKTNYVVPYTFSHQPPFLSPADTPSRKGRRISLVEAQKRKKMLTNDIDNVADLATIAH